MKVRIVSYDTQAWILVKFARKLGEHLLRLGVDVELGQTPDVRADINHHIIYLNYDGRKYATDTLMLTHFTMPWEMELARVQLENAALGVCMSTDSENRLVQAGFPRHKLCVVHPAHDGVIRPRKLVLGLTTRLYPDGRKREQMLVDVVPHVNPEDFRFRIMGDGWDKIVRSLRERNFHVEYTSRFDYARYCELIRSLDYYLYFGQDEGSMGFLDALAAGVPTIVTPQGFHLDVPDGITHPFETADQLVAVLTTIAREHCGRREAIASWTWENYARQHQRLWSALLENVGKGSGPPEDPGVVQRVRAIQSQRLSESFPEKLRRIVFREGPIRVGRRVVRRWLAGACR